MHERGRGEGTKGGEVTDILSDDGHLIRGCDCLTPAENAIIDADKNGEVDDLPLDPNTEYFSVLDGIRVEARKRCFDRAKELDLKPEQTNCHAITEAYLLGAGDGEPGFVETCALDKYEATCPDEDDATKTSSTRGDKPPPPRLRRPSRRAGRSRSPRRTPRRRASACVSFRAGAPRTCPEGHPAWTRALVPGAAVRADLPRPGCARQDRGA